MNSSNLAYADFLDLLRYATDEEIENLWGISVADINKRLESAEQYRERIEAMAPDLDCTGGFARAGE